MTTATENYVAALTARVSNAISNIFMFEDRTEPLAPYQIENRERSVLAAEVLSDLANGMSRDPENFLKALRHQHPTLQQSMTRLFMLWMEYVAQDGFRTDGRNESTKKLAQTLIKLMQESTGLEMPNILSSSLPTI